MAILNVLLSDPMKAWVEAQVADGQHSNASTYVENLIRRDQERRVAIAELQSLIDEGTVSGVSRLTRDELLLEARKRAAGQDAL